MLKGNYLAGGGAADTTGPGSLGGVEGVAVPISGSGPKTPRHGRGRGGVRGRAQGQRPPRCLSRTGQAAVHRVLGISLGHSGQLSHVTLGGSCQASEVHGEIVDVGDDLQNKF